MLKILWYSFFLESSWSYERNQTLGFLKILNSFIKPLPKAFLSLTTFNTNPYTAPALAGLLISLPTPQDNFLKTFKILASSLAANGDNFFWQFLRPLLSLVALTLLFFLKEAWLFLLFFLPYNFFTTFVRLWGFYLGQNFEYEGIFRLSRFLTIGSNLLSYLSPIPFLFFVIVSFLESEIYFFVFSFGLTLLLARLKLSLPKIFLILILIIIIIKVI